VRLDAIVLRALEHTPELRYQTIGEMRTQVMTVVNEPSPVRAGSHADTVAPRLSNVATCYLTTPEQLATFGCQMFLSRHKAQMLVDDRQLSFARAGTTTVIPLAAIRDLSIGHYPRVMSPVVRMDFISVTYEEGGETKRLFFQPIESWFGLRSHHNRFTAEWINAIRAAITAATGRAPGNTPANQLGTPSSSRAVLLFFLLMLLSTIVLLSISLSWLRNSPMPAAPTAAPLEAPLPPKIPGKPPDWGIKE
jgi:hypothetical protein